MKKTFIKITLFLSVLGTLLSFTRSSSTERIVFESDKLYPEGITYDEAKGLFYLGSLTTGKIVSVDKHGTCKVVCDDPRLISTVGIKYNAKDKKIYVLNSDMGVSSKTSEATKIKIAQLVIINPATSKIEQVIELADLIEGMHFGNDLTIDKEGNVYITDSYANVIYKVDKNGNKSIFSASPLFKPDSALSLNGIASHNDGFLIVAKSGDGQLLKVSTTDPTKVEKIKLPEPMFWGDGLYFISPEELVVVRNRFTKVVYLRSKDHWQSAEIVKEEKCSDLMPTTATVGNGKVYVLNSRLSEIRENKATSKQFVIDIF